MNCMKSWHTFHTIQYVVIGEGICWYMCKLEFTFQHFCPPKISFQLSMVNYTGEKFFQCK